MKVNIACSEANGGWIYSEFIRQFKIHSKHKIIVNSKTPCSITHLLPYYERIPKDKKKLTAWMSHQEKKQPLFGQFLKVGRAVDIAISHSEKYKRILGENGANAVQVIPGVDLGLFRLRSGIRAAGNRLKVGWVGRKYTSTPRKNSPLLKKIADLDWVEFSATGGKLKKEDMPEFYNWADIIISPALIEGGPMCIQEALACGTPVLCYSGVGVADEFFNGVIKVEFGDEKKFIERLKKFWKSGEILYYRDVRTMQKLHFQVRGQTWKRFVSEHDKIWGSL